jgi:hypothetical protein
VVVLSEPSSGVAANAKIMKSANLSADFHFDQIDYQIEQIQNELEQQANDGSAEQKVVKLKPGDFFVTKHSNLSQSHIIFHLISDENFHRYI